MTASMIAFDIAELDRMTRSICTVCETPLQPHRQRRYTCSERCHELWIERVIARHGETRDITDASTGLVHLVPTRLILEGAFAHKDLPKFPVRRQA